MIKQSLLVLSMVTVLGFVALNGLSVGDVLAQKNGWGEATSERATEQDPGDIGDHSRAGGAAGEPSFDSDGEGDEDKPGRQGIGNVGDSDDNNLHPNDLGNFLDCVDEDEGEGEGQNC
jgi:hypothetical protein